VRCLVSGWFLYVLLWYLLGLALMEDKLETRIDPRKAVEFRAKAVHLETLRRARLVVDDELGYARVHPNVLEARDKKFNKGNNLRRPKGRGAPTTLPILPLAEQKDFIPNAKASTKRGIQSQKAAKLREDLGNKPRVMLEGVKTLSVKPAKLNLKAKSFLETEDNKVLKGLASPYPSSVGDTQAKKLNDKGRKSKDGNVKGWVNEKAKAVSPVSEGTWVYKPEKATESGRPILKLKK
ncbi:MAG: hypothetical protein ACRCUJ_12970, partial [Phocaeicola sp.]